MSTDDSYAEDARQRRKDVLIYMGVFFATLAVVIGPISDPGVGLGICTAATLAVYGIRRFLRYRRSLS
ncbi:MAG TPA: hypothetical protein VKV25_07175 [Acidimicrobiales bacterium]|nr:hypothetical protein [Acidimicrobiales bacterium]